MGYSAFFTTGSDSAKKLDAAIKHRANKPKQVLTEAQKERQKAASKASAKKRYDENMAQRALIESKRNNHL